MSFLIKIWRKVVCFFLQPIRVYVFHTTGETYNPLIAWKCDWTHVDLLKKHIETLPSTYEFISLNEAYGKLKNDCCTSYSCNRYERRGYA